MYCRHCYYDLRGQLTPRCPECGTGFAFDDPSTFLPKSPGILGRGLLALRRRRRWAILALLTLLLLASYRIALILPSSSHWVHPTVVSTANLKNILTIWLVQQYKDPQQTEFDVDAARQLLRPSLSPWFEWRVTWWRESITRYLKLAPRFIVLTMLYLLVVMIFVGKRMRRGAIGLILALFVVLLCSIQPAETASWLCPESHALLDDYHYLPGIDITLSGEKAHKTIVAYDIQSFRRPGRRIIGLADGFVLSMWDDRARPLFEAQGLEYPAGEP
ncbi:MAG: hypothetical protein KJ749_01325 [Planctomycetes bacterium]|nr:hypothetical protein [Planctomycetota bacterium]